MQSPDDNIKKLFPLSYKYNENWVKTNSLGENVLYNLESLCGIINFINGERVLDLGCGKAVSSVFLAKEFNVYVWAVDKNQDATNNYKRIKKQNCESRIFPMCLDSDALPFAEEYFDKIICVDSYMYFGTDEKFIPYLVKFLRPGGTIGIVDICLEHEINYIAEAPEYIRNDFRKKWYFVHSLNWWKNMWEKTGLLKISHAEIVPQNQIIKNEYVNDKLKSNEKDYFAEALSNDNENFINIFRMAAIKI